MYPVSLGIDEAVRRIKKLLKNGHAGQFEAGVNSYCPQEYPFAPQFLSSDAITSSAVYCLAR